MAFYESDLAARRANSFPTALPTETSLHTLSALFRPGRGTQFTISLPVPKRLPGDGVRTAFLPGAKGVIARPTVIHE